MHLELYWVHKSNFAIKIWDGLYESRGRFLLHNGLCGIQAPRWFRWWGLWQGKWGNRGCHIWPILNGWRLKILKTGSSRKYWIAVAWFFLQFAPCRRRFEFHSLRVLDRKLWLDWYCAPIIINIRPPNTATIGKALYFDVGVVCCFIRDFPAYIRKTWP